MSEVVIYNNSNNSNNTNNQVAVSKSYTVDEYFKDELEKVNKRLDDGFVVLVNNLENNLVNIAETNSGKELMKQITNSLVLKVNEIKEADKKMLQVFRQHVEHDSNNDLGINEPLKDIYGNLFFLQTRLINDTFYKMITDKRISDEVRKPLTELFNGFQKKISLLNEYLMKNPINVNNAINANNLSSINQ